MVTGANVQDSSNKLFQKSVLRDCISMWFDICTIYIRVSIRVRGLHRVYKNKWWSRTRQFLRWHPWFLDKTKSSGSWQCSFLNSFLVGCSKQKRTHEFYHSRKSCSDDFPLEKNILCSIVLLVWSSHLVGSVPGDVPGISRVDETTWKIGVNIHLLRIRGMSHQVRWNIIYTHNIITPSNSNNAH